MRHVIGMLVASVGVVAAVSLPCIAAESSQGSIKEEKGRLTITMNRELFTVYHFGDAEGRPFVRPYFYPVRARDGAEVTSDQTLTGGDHPHHGSLWVAHGDVNGADHWSFAQKPEPKQRHVRFSKLGGDSFVEELEWEAKGGTGLVLRETRTVRFFSFEDGQSGIDLTVALTPAEGRVTLGDTKEAGPCAVRGTTAVTDMPPLTTPSGAAGEKQGWGRPVGWCDMSGPRGADPHGLAVLDQPRTARRPATWRAHQYGLDAANIFD